MNIVVIGIQIAKSWLTYDWKLWIALKKKEKKKRKVLLIISSVLQNDTEKNVTRKFQSSLGKE